MKFKAIAFDLDDTLIDTTGVLVPLASRMAYDRMTQKGLKTTFEIFEEERRIGALSMSHRLIFRSIAQKYGAPFSEEQAQAGIEAFYNPELPEKLDLLPGAQENLEKLKNRYKLFVVTSGAIPTQKEKARRANIEHFLSGSYYLDSFKKERKKLAFEDILQRLQIKPEELLVIGNRLSQEIRDGKIVGAFTCYFKYGEHVGEVAQDEYENPDVTILEHKEFIPTCRL